MKRNKPIAAARTESASHPRHTDNWVRHSGRFVIAAAADVVSIWSRSARVEYFEPRLGTHGGLKEMSYFQAGVRSENVL